MIRVILEVVDERERSWVAVRARSIGEALRAAGERYPDGEVELVLPIEAERFFAPDEPGLVEPRLSEMGEAPARIHDTRRRRSSRSFFAPGAGAERPLTRL
ncbi:hypothetical protein [Rubrobacter calidifluminis]|uniref:hypothetical protein n=1 Tax=Rubrobacter calidifluminis TaxID=1392640 RepID=UPI00236249C2|nr:hypothetical protein [Rubrobacter calidifluminis]